MCKGGRSVVECKSTVTWGERFFKITLDKVWDSWYIMSAMIEIRYRNGFFICIIPRRNVGPLRSIMALRGIFFRRGNRHDA